MNIDLNCDLCEGEPPARTAELMRSITSANLACGGHAGDAASMREGIRLANLYGVRVGAHPGLPGSFGRGDANISAHELTALVVEQVNRLRDIAGAENCALHHVKLHGALYHATEQSEALARAYLDTVASRWPKLKIYALAGGRIVGLAREFGLDAWDEVFADRGYHDDGTLVPRGESGALIHDPVAAVDRLQQLRQGRGVVSVTGRIVALTARTLCVHADTPGAVTLAAALRAALDEMSRKPRTQ